MLQCAAKSADLLCCAVGVPLRCSCFNEGPPWMRLGWEGKAVAPSPIPAASREGCFQCCPAYRCTLHTMRGHLVFGVARCGLVASRRSRPPAGQM